MAKILPEVMESHPTVFALHDTYQIFIPFTWEVIVSVRVGDEMFYDDANGMLRSATTIHRVEVPPSPLMETAPTSPSTEVTDGYSEKPKSEMHTKNADECHRHFLCSMASLGLSP